MFDFILPSRCLHACSSDYKLLAYSICSNQIHYSLGEYNPHKGNGAWRYGPASSVISGINQGARNISPTVSGERL